ncbi:threonine--tRNA ligase [Halobacterium wangiae]|uniref:threonine--tRNA ligase n=1 Tax=Halobacterium wangiae TaxID=2902623 RepID=UPI001E5CE9B3|nr:threonine--tRNA ligase [Halobacterium wangiae]
MSTVTVTLPDGSTLEMESGATVEDVAYEIGPGLGRDTVAGKVDHELVSKETPLTEDCGIEIVTEDSGEYLDVLRHTAAHVLAQAILRHHPDAKLTIGPYTDDGFYYDVANVELDADDLEAIQDEAEEIVAEDLDVERVEYDRETALEEYDDNPFKREILETEAAGEDPVSFYRQGEFEDLCRGPHVESTGEIGGFEVLETSAAYWRGDEERETLTRVYGTAFPTEDELDDYLERRAEAAERDHRKIGSEMDLFSIPDVTGPGLPLYHPNGKTVLRELSEYVQELNRGMGYDEVETPHLFRTELWKQSGHYDNYVDDMFLLDVNDEEYGLKPMNCPGHATIFNQGSWSYRDLPVRYFEDGKVYRKEQRGELSGLSRVWAFTIDDGHVFARADQVEEEVRRLIDIILEVLDTFDLDYEVALATRPEKSVGSDEIWERSESQLQAVLEEQGMDYDVEPGDGAFYGPKIDFGFEDALGRSWDGPTVQLDFNMPERFELEYTGSDNDAHQPVMIHRALYGSYERFFMVLVEHYDGRFPTWLAPEQVRILPVTDDNLGYAHRVKNELDGYRVEVEDRDWTVGRKIQQAHDDNVPYMLVVGDDEEDAGTVSVRDRQERERNDVDLETFRDHLDSEVGEKRTQPDFVE